MSNGCFRISCHKCGYREVDTWLGDVYPMTNRRGRTKCCGSHPDMIRRAQTGRFFRFGTPRSGWE